MFKLKTLFGLILCNLIWSANPAMYKTVLNHFTPTYTAWLRYVSALLAYMVFFILMRAFPIRSLETSESPFVVPVSKKDRALLALLGFMTFFFAPMTHAFGLSQSRATDNALIVAMEPLLAAGLGWLVLGEALSLAFAFVFSLSLVGFALLSGLSPAQLIQPQGHSIGNLLLLSSMLGEASYTVLGRNLIRRYSPQAIFGTTLFVGVFLLSCALIINKDPLPTLTEYKQLSWQTGFALLWIGPLGTTLSYLFWMYALRHAAVADISLTLFIQPVFGALLGYMLLGERITVVQSVGAVLIFVAVFGQSVFQLWQARGQPGFGASK